MFFALTLLCLLFVVIVPSTRSVSNPDINFDNVKVVMQIKGSKRISGFVRLMIKKSSMGFKPSATFSESGYTNPIFDGFENVLNGKFTCTGLSGSIVLLHRRVKLIKYFIYYQFF